MAGMGMPQMMQMGMPGMGAMMGGGMPQGIMMNPMMAMQKPTTDGKEEGSGKQTGSMSAQMMAGGGMPFMMAQVPSQLQGPDSNPQNPSGMQMGMMGQFPTMMQMPQQPQMQGNPAHPQGGMPMGYTMMLNPEQSRSMTPSQMQQLQLQMQMMMSKGMMPMMQMPKNDQNDPSKK